MLTKKILYIFALLTFLFAFYGFHRNNDFHGDVVPNEEIAEKIAEVILTPIIGKAGVDFAKPFKVTLTSSNIWVVKDSYKEGQLGGDILIEIQKSDCKILKVSIHK